MSAKPISDLVKRRLVEAVTRDMPTATVEEFSAELRRRLSIEKESRREAHNAWQRSYYKANPEMFLAASSKWRSRSKARSRAKNRERTYGITQEQWDALFEAQGRRCAVCRSDSPGSSKRHWSTDHCHTPGKVRGILCHQCNLMLGAAKDSPTTLQAAIDYLRR